jgi:aminoglycoside phosphotransferase (APT) family kinase protein
MSVTTPDEFLPERLRGPSTKATRLAAGLSGAGVYSVEAGGQPYVLKISGKDIDPGAWRRRIEILEQASAAGLAPRVVHVDHVRRSVTSVAVGGGSFAAFAGNPASREGAIALLGATLRRLHGLPLPEGMEVFDPQRLLGTIWADVESRCTVPPFVADSCRRLLAEKAPESAHAPVVSHNDLNPTNMILDGADLMLVDWDSAAPNEPLYDLATVSVFFRLNEGECLKLLEAHGAEAVFALPARFCHDRRLVAIMCGTMFLGLAGKAGHPGAAGDESLETTPTFVQVIQETRSGKTNMASPEGKWRFGLALVKTGAGL